MLSGRSSPRPSALCLYQWPAGKKSDEIRCTHSSSIQNGYSLLQDPIPTLKDISLGRMDLNIGNHADSNEITAVRIGTALRADHGLHASPDLHQQWLSGRTTGPCRASAIPTWNALRLAGLFRPPSALVVQRPRQSDAVGGIGPREGPPPFRIGELRVLGRHDRSPVTQGSHQRRGGGAGRRRGDPPRIG